MAESKAKEVKEVKPKDVIKIDTSDKAMVKVIINTVRDENKTAEVFGVNGKLFVVALNEEVKIPKGIIPTIEGARVMKHTVDKQGNTKSEAIPRFVIKEMK